MLTIRRPRRWGRVYAAASGTLGITLVVAAVASINRATAPTLSLTVLNPPPSFSSTTTAVVVPTNQLSTAKTGNQADKQDKTIYNFAKEAETSKSNMHQVIATIFWLGEKPSADNNYITNTETEWDPNPVTHFGGYDDPNSRTSQGLPTSFVPKHNPFYCAMPVSEYDNNGNLRPEARQRSSWASEVITADQSLLKGRWLRLEKDNRVVFCQWLDSGPYEEGDYDYVYGTSAPKNTVGEKAGIDLSPATAFALGVNGSGTVSWRFADSTEASKTSGLWNNYPAINNINYW